MSATRITTSRSAKGNADFQAAENVHVSASRTGPRSARAPCARLAGTRVGAAWALGHETRLQGVLPRARPAAWLRGHRSVPVWGAVTTAPQTCVLTVCTRVSSRADAWGCAGRVGSEGRVRLRETPKVPLRAVALAGAPADVCRAVRGRPLRLPDDGAASTPRACWAAVVIRVAPPGSSAHVENWDVLEFWGPLYFLGTSPSSEMRFPHVFYQPGLPSRRLDGAGHRT